MELDKEETKSFSCEGETTESYCVGVRCKTAIVCVWVYKYT